MTLHLYTVQKERCTYKRTIELNNVRVSQNFPMNGGGFIPSNAELSDAFVPLIYYYYK